VSHRLVVLEDLDGVDPDAWDALTSPHDPFTEYAFLAHLEASGSVGQGTGWLPRYVVLYDGDELVGATPAYAKSHSYGEYIFDWAWANACQRAGVRYYPKLTVAVPFTPATGRRLLVAEGPKAEARREALARGLVDVARTIGCSSVHALFRRPEEGEAFQASGYLPRMDSQFHWENKGYDSFEAFLGALRSKRRKEIRRERRQAAKTDLALGVEPVSGLSEADCAALYRCYRNTIDARGAIPYLTEAWWMGLPTALGRRGVVATARDGRGALQAGALAFHKGDVVYGRYWGALDEHRALHFELCYYQWIEWAIARGLRRVEAGAQGRHKLPRGFLPRPVYGSHWLAHAGLRSAVEPFVVEEAEAVREQMAHWMACSPYRVEEPPGDAP